MKPQGRRLNKSAIAATATTIAIVRASATRKIFIVERRRRLGTAEAGRFIRGRRWVSSSRPFASGTVRRNYEIGVGPGW